MDNFSLLKLSIEIFGAWYGPEADPVCGLPLAEVVLSDVRERFFASCVNDAVASRRDPAPNRRKALLVRYRMAGQDFEERIPEGELFIPAPLREGTFSDGDEGHFFLVAAFWGHGATWADVTEAARSAIPGPFQTFSFGTGVPDPCPLMPKTLVVAFQYDRRAYVRTFKERDDNSEATLLATSAPRNAAELLNAIIRQSGYSSYLEIGVAAGATFKAVKCALKHGVDPDPKTPATFHCTSDEFFSGGRGAAGYDLILVDGLHFFEQVLRDVNNSLLVLREGGTIIMHDVLPKTKDQQTRDGLRDLGGGWSIPVYEWPIDAWKALAILRATRSDLSIFTVDLDFGFGVVRRGRQEPWSPAPKDMLTFEYFQANRDQMLAVVPPDKALGLLAERPEAPRPREAAKPLVEARPPIIEAAGPGWFAAPLDEREAAVLGEYESWQGPAARRAKLGADRSLAGFGIVPIPAKWRLVGDRLVVRLDTGEVLLSTMAPSGNFFGEVPLRRPKAAKPRIDAPFARASEAPPLRFRSASFYMDNTLPAAEAQRRVFDAMGLGIDQVKTWLPHGVAIDEYLVGHRGEFDYLLIWDVDCIPLGRDAIPSLLANVAADDRVVGLAGQSNHLNQDHPYASAACIALSVKLWESMGQPTMRGSAHIKDAPVNRSDTAEDLTWAAEEDGVIVSLLWPSHVEEPLWRLGRDENRLGKGTTYASIDGSPLFYHAFEARHGTGRFLRKCEEVLDAIRGPSGSSI